MPATIFPAPGAASGSIQWNVYTITVIGSSSGNTITLSSGTTDNRWVGLTPAITSGTGQFATNTTITSVINSTSFTINNIPTVALSNATMTVTNGAMQVVTDNSRTVGKIRPGLVLKSTTNNNLFSVAKLNSSLIVRNPVRNDSFVYDVNALNAFKWNAKDSNTAINANTLANFNNNFWTYYNNTKKVSIGTPNPKLLAYQTVSSKVVSGSNTNLVINNPSSTIPFIKGGSTSSSSFAGNQYLSVAYNSAFNFGSGNFTIEAWIFPTQTNTQMEFLGNWPAGGEFIFRISSSNTLSFSYTNAASGISTITVTGTTRFISQNFWHHVAVVRNGATLTLYVNGIPDATTYNIGTDVLYYYNAVNTALTIGWAGVGNNTTPFIGSMSNVRIVKNAAVYTGPFIPYGPLNKKQYARQNVRELGGNETILLTLHNTLTDLSNNTFSISNVGIVTTTTNTTLGIVPLVNEYVLITDFSNNDQAIAQIKAVTQNPATPSYTLTVETSSISALNSSNTWLIHLWEIDIQLQSNFATTTKPSSARDNLYYSSIAPGKFGKIFPYDLLVNETISNVSLGNIGRYKVPPIANPIANDKLYYNINNLKNSFSPLKDTVLGNKFTINNVDRYKSTAINQVLFTPVIDYLKPITSLRDTTIENRLSSGKLEKSKFANNQIFYSPINDRLEVFDSAYWTLPNFTNSVSVGIPSIKNNTNNIVFNLISNSRTTSGSNSLINVATNTYYGSFNGSTQNLFVSTFSPIQTVATSPFTIECWVYNLAFTGICVASSSYGGSGTIPYVIGFGNGVSFQTTGTNGSYPYFASYNGSWTFQIYSPTACVINTWYHFAVSYDGTTVRLFINGILANSAVTNSPSQTSASTAGFYVGRRWDTTGGNAYFNGYISNFRFVKGVAVYTNNFAPSSPLSRIQSARNNVSALTGSETSLLTLQNATIIDNSLSNGGLGFSITNTGTVSTFINTSFSAFLFPPVTNEYLLLTDIVTNNQKLAPISSVTTGTNSYTFSIANSYLSNLGSSNAWLVQLWDPELIQQAKIQTNLNPTNARENLYYSQLAKSPKYTVSQYIVENTDLPKLNDYGKLIAPNIFGNNRNVLFYTPSLNNINATILQRTVSTNIRPTNPRENLFYATLARGLFGNYFPSKSSHGDLPKNINANSLSNIPTNYWTYQNNTNRIAVGQPSSKLLNYSTISQKTTNGSNILLTINNPTSGINYITSGETYYSSFNGSTQYLTVPANAAFSFGVGDFTIECWINAASFSNVNGKMIVDARPAATNGAYWVFGLDLTGKPVINLTNGSTTYTGPTSVATSTWTHLAATRQSGTVRLFVNGSIVASGTGNTDIAGSSGLFIGQNAFMAADTYFNGNISNLRIVKGKAVYTGPFIPLGPLSRTQPVRQNVIELSGPETSLLLLQSSSITVDNSINSFSITNVGSILAPTRSNAIGGDAIGNAPVVNEYALITDTVTNNQALSPILAVTTTNTALGTTVIPFGTYSIQFTGSNQYLTYDPSVGSTLAFGTNDFTVEMWIYSSTTLDSQYLFDSRVTGSTSSWAFGWNLGSGSGVLAWTFSGATVSANGTGGLRTSWVFSPNTWYHVAYVRRSNDGYIYINGSQQATATDITNYSTNNNIAYIGQRYTITNNWQGYISNLRIVKGTAVYTSSFTVPTSPLAVISGTSLLTAQSSTIIDASSTIVPFSNMTVATNYGLFNNSRYLTIPANARFNFSNGDFTIEFWALRTSASGSNFIATNRSSVGSTFSGSWWIDNNSNQIRVFFYTSGNVARVVSNTNALDWPAINTWFHFAIVRYGTTLSAYLNGNLMGNVAVGAAEPFGTSADNVYIGRFTDSFTWFWPGYISNFRIVKGEALYTGNFTPSGPLATTVNIGTVSLLALQSSSPTDDTTGLNSISNTGGIVMRSSGLYNNGGATVSSSVIPTFTTTVNISAASHIITIPSSSVSNLNSSNTWVYSLWDPEIIQQTNILTNRQPSNARENLYYASLAKGRYGQYSFKEPTTSLTNNVKSEALGNFPLESLRSPFDTNTIIAGQSNPMYSGTGTSTRIITTGGTTTIAFTRPGGFPKMPAVGEYVLLTDSSNRQALAPITSSAPVGTGPFTVTSSQVLYTTTTSGGTYSSANNAYTFSWLAPPNVYRVSVVAIGGGGGGASTNTYFALGGSGGALAYRNNITVIPGQYYTVQVGAGGAGVLSPGSDEVGGNGGASFFKDVLTVYAGGGGAGNIAVSVTYGQTLFTGGNVTGTGGTYTGVSGNSHAYTWTCPTNVFSICVVCVGAGGGGTAAGAGGGGGALAWANNISVTPGETYNILSGIAGGGGAGSSGGNSSFTVANGSVLATGGLTSSGGGAGGTASITSGISSSSGGGSGGKGALINPLTNGSGGGGAGGYGGNGGAGGNAQYNSNTGAAGSPGAAGTGGAGGGGGGCGTFAYTGGGGGGVGVFGVGSSGAGGAGGNGPPVGQSGRGGGGGSSGTNGANGSGSGGTGGAGGTYGAGGGGGSANNNGGTGGVGAVRIIWPAVKLSDGSIVRAFGASSSVLATDQSGSFTDSVSGKTFLSSSGGTYIGDGGGSGGNSGQYIAGSGGGQFASGGGGAGGYSGAGGAGGGAWGNGSSSAAAGVSTAGAGGAGGGGGATGYGTITASGGAGGGVGVLGSGSNGAAGNVATVGASPTGGGAGSGGSAGNDGSTSTTTIISVGGSYGGGGGGIIGTITGSAGSGAGAPGAVRIIWPSNKVIDNTVVRAFPNTLTTDQNSTVSDDTGIPVYEIEVPAAYVSNLSTSGNWTVRMHEANIVKQNNVLTNLSPINARENLYYANLVKNRYGIRITTESPVSMLNNLTVSAIKPTFSLKTPLQIPNNYKLSHFDTQYWKYDQNKIAVGQENPKYNSVNTVSSKSTVGLDTLLTFNDPSSNIKYITNNSTYYGTFNGSSQRLYAASTSAFDLGTGDFTIEGWFNFSNTSQWAGIAQGSIQVTTIPTGVWWWQWNGTTTANKFSFGLHGGAQVDSTATFIPIVNTWYHIATVRISGSISFYVNGSILGTPLAFANSCPALSIMIGANYNLLYFAGNISNFRIVKGVGVYTGTFTPLGPLTITQISRNNVRSLVGSETSMLTLQSSSIVDNSIANNGIGFVISNGGTVLMTFSSSIGSPPVVDEYLLLTDTVTNNQDLSKIKSINSTSAASFNAPLGQVLFDSSGIVGIGGSGGTYNSTTNTYAYTWTAPANVYSVSVVCVGGGGGGAYAGTGSYPTTGGGGGALAWKNNISVLPGVTYNVQVGGGGSGIISSNTLKEGGNGGTSYFINANVVAASGGSGGQTNGATSIQLGQVLFEGGGNRSDGGTAGTYSSLNNAYSYTWTVPDNVFSICIVCVGGGGGGGSGYGLSGGGGGGGGLVWVNNISVVPGTVYTVQAGAGGASLYGFGEQQVPEKGNGTNSGGDSWFNTSTYIVGKGGGAGGYGSWSGAGIGGTNTVPASVGGSFSNTSGFTGGGGSGGIGRGGTNIGDGYIAGAGGGAGGYSGAGGIGAGPGQWASSGTSTAGAGGGGGGGGGFADSQGSTIGYASAGAGGGGVGVYGAGANGAAGISGNPTGGIAQTGGGGGSGGQTGGIGNQYQSNMGGYGGLYGGGGCGLDGNGSRPSQRGGIGAVRIIWPATKVSDASVVRAFAGTSAGNVLTTDQSGVISDIIPSISIPAASGGTVLAGTGGNGGAGGQTVLGTSTSGSYASGGGGAGGYGGNGGAGGGAWGDGSSNTAAGISTSGTGGAGGGGGASGFGTVTASGGAGGGVSVSPTSISIGLAGYTGSSGSAPSGGSGGSGGSSGSNGYVGSGGNVTFAVGGVYGGGGAGGISVPSNIGSSNGSSGAVRIIWPAVKVQDGSTVRAFGSTTGSLVSVSDQSGVISDVQPFNSYTVIISTDTTTSLNNNNTWSSQVWDPEIMPQSKVLSTKGLITARDNLYYSSLAKGKYGRYFTNQLNQALLPNNVLPSTLSNFDNQYWAYPDTPNRIAVGTVGTRYTPSIRSGSITVNGPNTTIVTSSLASTVYAARFTGLSTGTALTSTFGYISFSTATAITWTSSFCIEFYINIISWPTSNNYNIISTGGLNAYTLVNISTTGISLINPGYATWFTAPFSISGGWHHIAIMGNATNTWVAYDGVTFNYAGVAGGVGAGYTPGSTFGTSFGIAGSNPFNSPPDAMTGQDFYLANFRIVSGSTVYNTSGFAKPTTIPQAIDGTQILTLISGTIADSSQNSRTITVGSYNGSSPSNVPTMSGVTGTPFYNIPPTLYFPNDQLLITDIVTNNQTIATVTSCNFVDTVTIPTNQVSNLDTNNAWTMQLWETDILQQANVRTTLNPTKARDNLLYATLARGKYGVFFPYKEEPKTTTTLNDFGNLNKGRIFSTANSVALYYSPTSDSLSIINNSYWTDTNNTNIVITGQASPKTPILYPTPISKTVIGSNVLLTFINSVSNVNYMSLGSTYYSSFNGSSQYITTPNNALLVLAGSVWTVECWFYTNGDYSVYRTIFAKRIGITASCSWEGYLRLTTGVISFYNGTNYESSTTPTAGTWHHGAWVYDGTNINIYLNGIRVLQSPVTITDYDAPVSVGAVTSPGEFFSGSISNFRVVKGVQVYTGNFAPQGPLSRIQNGRTNVSPLSGGETSLLLLQSSTIVDSSFAHLIKYMDPTATTYYGMFNGINQYLSAGYNSAFDIWNNTGTIELWYQSTNGGKTGHLFVMGNDTQNRNWLISAGGELRLGYAWRGNYYTTIRVSGIVQNTWYHIALSVLNGNITLYVNGQNQGATGSSYYEPAAGQSLWIGTQPFSPLSYDWFQGYISNFRIVKGTALYTQDFTPAGPLTTSVSGGTVSILALQSINATTDVTNNNTITNNNSVSTFYTPNNIITNINTVTSIPTISVVGSTPPAVNDYLLLTDNLTNKQALAPINSLISSSAGSQTVATLPVQTYSVQFNGSNQYLTVPPSSAFAFDTGDFTIEYWIYFTSAGASRALTNRLDRAAAFGTWSVSMGDTYVNFTEVIGGEPGVGSSFSSIVGQWAHIAVCRVSGTTTIYLNGNSVGSGSQTTNFNNSSYNLNIGWSPNENYIPGYISNVRIIKGQAVYTGNFTPSGPLTTTSQGAIAANVSLLTLQNATIIDNSSNGFSISNPNGAPVSGSFTPPFTTTTIVTSADITYTTSISSSYVSNLNIDNSWTAQLWDPEVIPQSKVRSSIDPTNPRENLYYSTLARSKYGNTDKREFDNALIYDPETKGLVFKFKLGGGSDGLADPTARSKEPIQFWN